MRKISRRRKKELKAKMRFNEYMLPSDAINCHEYDELHYLMPGMPPDPEIIAEMTKSYQNNIRNSELFEMWVRDFGLEKAEEFLKECRMEIRL